MPNKTQILLNAICSNPTSMKNPAFGEINPGNKIELISTLFPKIENWLTNIVLIDTHSHIYFDSYNDDIDKVNLFKTSFV